METDQPKVSWSMYLIYSIPSESLYFLASSLNVAPNEDKKVKVQKMR